MLSLTSGVGRGTSTIDNHHETRAGAESRGADCSELTPRRLRTPSRRRELGDLYVGLPEITTTPTDRPPRIRITNSVSRQFAIIAMSEERSKISLRSGGKRKGRPQISAPRQISEPILKDGSSARVPAPAGRPGPSEPPRSRPRPPPQSSGAVGFPPKQLECA